jgi:hypothetical protein
VTSEACSPIVLCQIGVEQIFVLSPFEVKAVYGRTITTVSSLMLALLETIVLHLLDRYVIEATVLCLFFYASNRLIDKLYSSHILKVPVETIFK